MNNKKKYLSIITNFTALESLSNIHSFLFEKLSEKFEKIYVINDEGLKFFPKIAKFVYRRHEIKEKTYKEINKLPENFVFFDPKDSKDFSKFLEDKSLLVINNFSRHFFSIKTHLLLKKHKIHQIQISNLGTMAMQDKAYLKHFFRYLFFHFNQTLFKKLVPLLSNLGILPKIDILFLSNKKIVENINKNFLKKFLYKNNFLLVKKIILINSRSYDIYIDKKIPLKEDYIVHLDASLNYDHNLLRGKLDKERINMHYHYLEKFLKRLSEEFNKKVLVCIHSAYSMKEQQSYFKEFEVLKFKTRDCIYNSFLVTTFDSSAVEDAVLLKKKILGFISDFMTTNEIEHSKRYANKIGYLTLNTKKDYLFDKEKILFQMNNNLSNYEKHISNYHCLEPNKLGINKIIDTIKEKFFQC